MKGGIFWMKGLKTRGEILLTGARQCCARTQAAARTIARRHYGVSAMRMLSAAEWRRYRALYGFGVLLGALGLGCGQEVGVEQCAAPAGGTDLGSGEASGSAEVGALPVGVVDIGIV
jgi:hypothetical protein